MALGISAGGQIYDRTTGTWAGATQGSIGDGVDRAVSLDRTKVWRDANGIVGYQISAGGTGPGASQVTNAGTGGAGPGLAGVRTGGPGSGGSGPGGVGSPGRSAGPGNPGAAGFVPKGTTTLQQIGETFITIDNTFPNVEDFWEPRYGEPGELVGGIVNMAADGNASAERILAESVRIKPGSIADKVVKWDGWGKLETLGNSFSQPQAPGQGGDGWEKLMHQDRIWSQQLHRNFGTGVVVPMGGF